MLSLYHTYIYTPLYNALVFIITHIPEWAGVGVGVILLTIIVKFVLFPLSRSTLKTQMRMKEIEPKMNAIRAKHKGDQQKMSLAIMEMYKEEKVNPFSSFFSLFLIIIQFPILVALYKIFYSGGLPSVHSDLLYSFVPFNGEPLNTSFLGDEDELDDCIHVSNLTLSTAV